MILFIKVVVLVCSIMGVSVLASVQLWLDIQYAPSIVCMVLGMVISIAYIVRYVSVIQAEDVVHIDPNAHCASCCNSGGIKGVVLEDGRQGCEVTCNIGMSTAHDGVDCPMWNVYKGDSRYDS